MKNHRALIKSFAAAIALSSMGALPVRADDHGPGHVRLVQSEPGSNSWNIGLSPADWEAELARYHGHVGPWNVLGWRIGQAALREMESQWGQHEIEVVCYVPPQTPFTCMVDGLSVGTGNSQGRMDLRIAEVLSYPQSFVAVKRKDGKGGVIEFRPRRKYLKSIIGQPREKLEALCHKCEKMPEARLFAIRRIAE